MKLSLPRPKNTLECRSIYLCHSQKTGALMYFTSELNAQRGYFLCAWTKAHNHMLLRTEDCISEFENVFYLFNELADFEPGMEAAR